MNRSYNILFSWAIVDFIKEDIWMDVILFLLLDRLDIDAIQQSSKVSHELLLLDRDMWQSSDT